MKNLNKDNINNKLENILIVLMNARLFEHDLRFFYDNVYFEFVKTINGNINIKFKDYDISEFTYGTKNTINKIVDIFNNQIRKYSTTIERINYLHDFFKNDKFNNIIDINNEYKKGFINKKEAKLLIDKENNKTINTTFSLDEIKKELKFYRKEEKALQDVLIIFYAFDMYSYVYFRYKNVKFDISKVLGLYQIRVNYKECYTPFKEDIARIAFDTFLKEKEFAVLKKNYKYL